MVTDNNLNPNIENQPVLIQEDRGHAVIITLNRPKSMNSLNFEMLYALRDAIDALQYRSEVRTVIITGAGEKAFCCNCNSCCKHYKKS
ncbi:MAG: enoyl-CoA hydratase/isomerase family protein, partial [Desulfamplus sp.]|nr:enoyl-CoA hydratase/isomerase family protein [Desulfamplus sp.]